MADSGVIFHDSPLQQYLTEIHAASQPVQREISHEAAIHTSAPQHDHSGPQPAAHRLSHRSELQRAQLARVLVSSPLLSNDDALLLHSLDPTLFHGPLPAAEVQKTTAGLAASSRAWRLAGFTAAALGMAIYTLRARLSLQRPLVLTAVAAAATAGGVATSALFSQRPASGSSAPKAVPLQLSRQLEALDAMTQLVSRCIREIQSVELLHRGFRLAGPRLPPISRLEQQSAGSDGASSQSTGQSRHDRLCQPLRVCLDAVLRSQLDTLRRLTQTLLKSYPIAVWDAADRLHADMPLSAFGGWPLYMQQQKGA